MRERDPEDVGGPGEEPGGLAREARPEEGVDRGSAAPEPADERVSQRAGGFDPDLVEGAAPRLDATDLGEPGAPADALGHPREGEGSERR